MNINDFEKEIQAKVKELDKLAKDILPTKIGVLAKRHFQDNFRNGGFVDDGLKPWQKAKRQSSKSADAKYGTLLSRQRNLFKGLEYIPSPYGVKICNQVPYASVHNWGETVYPRVTSKMRKFGWAKYFASYGIKKTDSKEVRKQKIASAESGAKNQAEEWKRLALTKKEKLSIKMPQRQFLGESKELNEAVRDKIENEVEKILKS